MQISRWIRFGHGSTCSRGVGPFPSSRWASPLQSNFRVPEVDVSVSEVEDLVMTDFRTIQDKAWTLSEKPSCRYIVVKLCAAEGIVPKTPWRMITLLVSSLVRCPLPSCDALSRATQALLDRVSADAAAAARKRNTGSCLFLSGLCPRRHSHEIHGVSHPVSSKLQSSCAASRIGCWKSMMSRHRRPDTGRRE